MKMILKIDYIEIYESQTKKFQKPAHHALTISRS